MSKNISHLSGRRGLKQNLFEEIAASVQLNGRLDEEAARKLAEDFLVGTASVYGTASFYDFTREDQAGKKVYVCNGTACLTAGTQKAVRDELSRHFAADEIGEMCCLGRCHENSAFQYAGSNYSGTAIGELTQIRNSGRHIRDRYAVRAMGNPILTGSQPSQEVLREQLLVLLSRKPEAWISELKLSGLRGRGGAGFPMSIKVEACARTPGETKFIVCNADEGDPGSYSDRYLLEQQPYLVLFGLLAAGYMVGADRGVVYLRAEYPESAEALAEALDQFREWGFCGEHILGSEFSFAFKVILAQGAYICGEETALLSSIEGQRPEVRVRPPFPVQEGLFGKPTLVNNVETLANLFAICRDGGAAFAAIGAPKSTGTKLVSLDSHFNRSGICEVPMGTALRDVVFQLGGGFTTRVKALHIGGPLGGLVPIHKVDELQVDFESFASQGFLLGHASIVSVPDAFPMIEYLEHLFAFTAHESCGKCFPCRIGSVRGRELLHKARTSEGFLIDKNLFGDLLDAMKRGSLCALGGGVPLPVYNALQYFEQELRTYFSKGSA